MKSYFSRNYGQSESVSSIFNENKKVTIQGQNFNRWDPTCFKWVEIKLLTTFIYIMLFVNTNFLFVISF